MTPRWGAATEFVSSEPFPVIAASLEGRSPAWFVLDTGAAISVLSRTYCDRHAIAYSLDEVYPVQDAAGNWSNTYPTTIQRLELASATVEGWTAHVMELHPKLQVAGILSPLNLFRQADVEMDFRGGSMVLWPPDSRQPWSARVGEPLYPVALVWDQGLVLVRAHVELSASFTGLFLLDSGAVGHLISPDGARQVGHHAESNEVFNSVAAVGSAQVSPGFVGRLSVGSAPEVPAEFLIKRDGVREAHSLTGEQSVGVIGLPWMRARRHLYLASRELMLSTGTQAP